jgi:hypothetical protein
MNKCLLCDYKWEARIENPKECPACKSRIWNQTQKLKVGRRDNRREKKALAQLNIKKEV